MLNQSKHYVGGTIAIDGEEYVDCLFDGTMLVYAGGELPGFERCRFTRIRIGFEAPAARTHALIQAMADPESGLESIFEQMFPRPPAARPEEQDRAGEGA